MMRQYEGLKSLTSIKPNLQRFIFSNADNKPQASNGSSVCQTSKLLSVVPRSVFKHLTSTLNDAQLLAVQKIMTGKVRENVALLQGPPGKAKFFSKMLSFLFCMTHQLSFEKELEKHP